MNPLSDELLEIAEGIDPATGTISCADAARRLRRIAAQHAAAPGGERPRGSRDVFIDWLNRNWPLWRNEVGNPRIAMLRRAFEAGRAFGVLEGFREEGPDLGTVIQGQGTQSS